MNSIKICPQCKKIVEAKEYVSQNDLSDWRASFGGSSYIVCSRCSYRGLAIELNKDRREDTHD